MWSCLLCDLLSEKNVWARTSLGLKKKSIIGLEETVGSLPVGDIIVSITCRPAAVPDEHHAQGAELGRSHRRRRW